MRFNNYLTILAILVTLVIAHKAEVEEDEEKMMNEKNIDPHSEFFDFYKYAKLKEIEN